MKRGVQKIVWGALQFSKSQKIRITILSASCSSGSGLGSSCRRKKSCLWNYTGFAVDFACNEVFGLAIVKLSALPQQNSTLF
jgi:hypothetical protein